MPFWAALIGSVFVKKGAELGLKCHMQEQSPSPISLDKGVFPWQLRRGSEESVRERNQ